MEEKNFKTFNTIKTSQAAIAVSFFCISIMIILVPIIHYRLDSKFINIQERMDAFKVIIKDLFIK